VKRPSTGPPPHLTCVCYREWWQWRCAKEWRIPGVDHDQHVREWEVELRRRQMEEASRPRSLRRPAMMFGLFAAIALGGIDLGDRRR
jgi:hypothetical protein